MRLGFLGTPDFAVPTLAALIAAGHEVAAVYSQPPSQRGRGRVSTPSAVHAFAAARGIEVRTPPCLRGPAETLAFAALKLDAAVVVAFGQILPLAILQASRLGSFNLHASLLPRWRGAAPIQRALMAGDAVTGASVMRMTEGLDEGPVLATVEVAIGPLETAGTLFARLAGAGAPLMVETLEAVAHGAASEADQPGEGVTYARKIRPAEGRILWDLPADLVDRQIRGLSPFPGAWFTAPSQHGAVRIKALLCRPEAGAGQPGEVIDEAFTVACADGSVRILRAQREGRAAQEGRDFLRGFPLAAGTLLS
ncbi:MAG TPA: methionyl-tRNA formyltransferase [Caulobacteraceae bacterium]